MLIVRHQESGMKLIAKLILACLVCGMLGGKGGGRPSMAQGGGPDAAQLDLALKVGHERIIAALKG